jgi:hypothetical protein
MPWFLFPGPLVVCPPGRICNFKKFLTPSETGIFFRPLEEGRMLSSLLKARMAWSRVTEQLMQRNHKKLTSCTFLGSPDPSIKTNVPNNSMIQLRAKVWAFILPPLGVGMSCRMKSSALSVCTWSGRRKTWVRISFEEFRKRVDGVRPRFWAIFSNTTLLQLANSKGSV